MFSGFDTLMKHMAEEHPNSIWYGDSVVSFLSGEIISQKCQICGKELVPPPMDENTCDQLVF
jgi:uncharacterized OB-fold protein